MCFIEEKQERYKKGNKKKTKMKEKRILFPTPCSEGQALLRLRRPQCFVEDMYILYKQ